MPSRKAQKKQHWRRSNPAETHNQRRPSKKQERSARRKLADDEWRGCLRKVRFGSQAAAEVELRKLAPVEEAQVLTFTVITAHDPPPGDGQPLR